MVLLRAVLTSVITRGPLIGIWLRPQGLILPSSGLGLFMESLTIPLKGTLLNVSASVFLMASTTTPMLDLLRMQIKKPIERLLGSVAIIRRFPFITILRITISCRIRISAKISSLRLRRLFATVWRPLALSRVSMRTLTGSTTTWIVRL